MADEQKPPSWFKVEHVGLVFQVAVVLGGLSIWLISNVDRTSSVAAAMVTVNSRLDHIADKLEGLPVLVERVKQAEQAISESKGGYATLDTRLRVIENNIAVTHAEVEKKHGAN